MKKIILLLLVVVTGCQTAKIKNREYKVSQATVELGSIGWAKSMYNLDNDFSIHAIPVLQNKIRLDVQVLPFNRDIYKAYTAKSEQRQGLAKISYADSLPVKPEYVTLSLMDINGMSAELSGQHNSDVVTYIKDTEKAVIVTGVAVVLSAEDLAKVKLADAYYLINSQDKKYTIALFKAGKKTDSIDLQAAVEVAYTLGKFCWALSERQQWYISDIVNNEKNCKGNTRSKIEEKEEKNLFKM